MTTIVRRWLMRLLHPHRETDAARERVLRDHQRAELHASRIERDTEFIVGRVELNHISAQVNTMLNRRRRA